MELFLEISTVEASVTSKNISVEQHVPRNSSKRAISLISKDYARPITFYKNLFVNIGAQTNTQTPEVQEQGVNYQLSCLSKEQQAKLLNEISHHFSDIINFQEVYESAIKYTLAGPAPNHDTCNLVKRLFFKKLQIHDKTKLSIANEAIRTACTMMLLLLPHIISKHLLSRTEFFEKYPHIAKIDNEVEKEFLYTFCNTVRVTLIHTNPRQNKFVIINVGSRIENSGKTYICGGGQSIETTNRVIIYETEGNIIPQKRKPKSKENINSTVKIN